MNLKNVYIFNLFYNRNSLEYNIFVPNSDIRKY
jgi:hypothetical protein